MKKILSILTLLVAFAVQGVADTWTVAGTAAALNGTVDWAENNAANDMTSTDGVNYTLTVTGCTLENGTEYKFKVVKNHDWKEAYPSSDKVFTVEETAVYTVEYTFNTETKDVTVTTTKTGEAGAITHTYTVAGTPAALFGTVWTPSLTDNDMDESDIEPGVYTWTKNGVELGSDLTIEFKVCQDHAWGVAYPGDNYVVKSGDHGYSVAGTYNVTISFDSNTQNVTAVFTLQAYYLVGELTGGWPENNEDQTKDVQMTKQSNGLYTYEVASFAAEAQKYEYKLRANKIWGLYELPSSGNAEYTFAEAGNYKLTFTANVTDAEIDGVSPYTLKLDAKKLEEVSDYYVIGDNGTEWVALGKMDYFADMKQYDYTLDKTWTGKYFAIAPASALNADGSVADWSKVLRPKTDKGNYLVELRNYDDKVVTGGNNVWEKADDITKIRIVYYINQQLFYLYPYSEVTISSAGYATYSHKYDYYVGTEASIVKAVNGGEAELEKLELDLYSKGIPGGTGVILKGSPFNYTIYPYEKNDNNEYVDVTGNMLIGSGNSTFNLNANDYTAYLLQTVNGQTGFQKWNGDTTTPLAAHKAFLAIPNVTAGAPAFISFGGGTTGIEAVTQSQRTGQYYTLDGRRVENPTKGLYIINGKKVVIK